MSEEKKLQNLSSKGFKKRVEQMLIDIGIKDSVQDAPYWIYDMIYTLISKGWRKP